MKKKIMDFFGNKKKQSKQTKKTKGKGLKDVVITYIVLSVIGMYKETNFLVERIIKSFAKAMGEENLPTPDEKVQPPIEKWIRAKYQGLVHILASQILGHIAKMFSIFYFKRDDLKLLFQDPDRYYGRLKEHVFEKWNKALEASRKRFEDKTKWLSEKIEDLKAQVKTVKENLLKLADELGVSPSHGKICLAKPIYFVWITIIAIADIVAIATALSVMRENVIFTYALTIGIAVSLIVSSDLSGIMLKSYYLKKERRKLIIPLVVALFAFLITVFLGEARLFYLSQADDVEFPALIRYGFTALNFFFFFVSTFASYRLHHKNLPKAREYNSLLNKKKRLTKKEKKTMKELDKVKQEELAEAKGINEEFQAEVDLLDNKEFELRENISDVTEQINMAKVTFNENFCRINQHCHENIQRFRAFNQLHRTDKKTCKYWEQPVADLEHDFDNYGHVYALKNGVLNYETKYEDYNNEPQLKEETEVENNKEEVASTVEEKNDTSEDKKKNNGEVEKGSGSSFLPVKFKFPVISLLIALFFFAASCSQTAPVKTSVMAVVDKTPEAKSEAYTLKAENVLEIMGVDEETGAINYGDFTITTINDISRNAYETASLDARSSFDNKFVRKEKLEAFENDVQKYIDDAYNSDVHYKHSQIYATVCEASKQLVSKKSDRKVLLILSDLLENSEISFYQELQYGSLDHDAITSVLEQKCELPNLDGVEVTIVFHTTSPEIDRIVVPAQKYWKQLFESKGARVSLKANL